LHVEPEPDRPVSARFFGYRLILDPARSLMAKEMAKIFNRLLKNAGCGVVGMR
jgi:hypothetical protein